MKLIVRVFNAKDYSLEFLLANSYLKDSDKVETNRYKVEETKKEKIISAILKNKYIGEYHENEFGKHLSNDKHFNVSHSHGLVVFVMDEVPVGIDIEKSKIIDKNMVNFISNDAEKAYISDEKSFFEIWTNKESLVKALGSGLKGQVKDIPGLPINGKRVFEGKTFVSRTIEFKDFIISVTREKDEDFDLELVEESIPL